MPELPEVETVARELRRFLPGQRVRLVRGSCARIVRPDARALAQALRGRVFQAVERHGKHLFLRFEGGPSVAVHLGMTGQVLAVPRSQAPDAYCRLEIRLAGSDRKLLFRDVRRFGRVELLTGTPAEFVRAKGLGPDALGIRPDALYQSLHRTRRCLKAALLDQRVLAGVGNIYADEVLFRERLSPLRPAASLSRRRVQALAARVREVLRSAIRRRGTSISDYVDPDGRRGGFQFVLQVYGRQGQPCPRCGARIVRGVVAGRGTWTCPRCQREPAPRARAGGRAHWTGSGIGATLNRG